MQARGVILGVCALILIEQIHGSFWNEIPQRCTYDRRTIFACWNTTFLHPIPLLHDLEYTFQNHQVHIRNSLFQLSLRELLINVGTNIENLTLINNRFSQSVIEQNVPFEGGLFFRLLLSLQIRDIQGMQWLQLNGSYFPQLITLDLSSNGFHTDQKLVFDHQYYPKLQTLDLSYNHLKSLDNLQGNALNTIERLILAHNPLESIGNDFDRFQSLRILDLSSTIIKQLFSITLTPNLHTLICQHCQQIPTWEIEKFLTNCSHLTTIDQLTIDFTYSEIYSIKFFNPYIKCIRNLILNEQNLAGPITTKDLLHSTNLQSIELRRNSNIDYVYLNVYDHLISADFSENIYLYQVILRLMSNYTHLQRLNLSHTALNDFSVDFYNSSMKFLHIDLIDMSHSRLETLQFLQYLTFHTLDVSYNRLKIIDISNIHYRNGMYDLLQMNLLNLSANEMEYIKINWKDQSPHNIDLSNNRLESLELHGQTTYTLLLGNNPKLTLSDTTFHLDIPSLKYLDLTSIDLHALEYLIYLHNLSDIHTLILNNNCLAKEHRILNWQLFEPWRTSLTHLSLANISLEQLDSGAYLDEFNHLLTIDFSENRYLQCNCKLQPFIRWLQTSPPILADIHEPLQKLLRINCPISLFELHCRDNHEVRSITFSSLTHSSFFRVLFILLVFTFILTIIFKLINRHMKRSHSRFYQRVYTDGDFISLHERPVIHKVDDQ